MNRRGLLSGEFHCPVDPNCRARLLFLVSRTEVWMGLKKENSQQENA
jgi:hypothetical protein